MTNLSLGKLCYWAYSLIGFKATTMVLWLWYLVDYYVSVIPVVSRKFLRSEIHSFINMRNIRYWERDNCCLVPGGLQLITTEARAKIFYRLLVLPFCCCSPEGKENCVLASRNRQFREICTSEWRWQEKRDKICGNDKTKPNAAANKKCLSYKYWFTCIFCFWWLIIPFLENV